MAFGNYQRHDASPAVALAGLLMALRRFLRTGTTGDRETLEKALDLFDNGEHNGS